MVKINEYHKKEINFKLYGERCGFLNPFNNSEYHFILGFFLDLFNWNFLKHIYFSKNHIDHNFNKYTTKYCNNIVVFSNCITNNTRCKSYIISEPIKYILPKNNSNNNSYYHIREINYKLKRVYDLLNCKYKAAIIRIPYFTDIKKLNIKQQYETFLISYENYSYILINIF